MIDMGDGAPESVLNPNGTLLGFRVFDKTEITPSTIVKNYGAEAGLPVKYSIQPAYGTLSTFDADASRVIRFDGIRSTHRKLNVNQGWGESVYDVANSAVSAYGASLDSCLELLKRCYIRYLGIENFWQGLQDDERASFMGRAVKMINDVQNNSSLTVSDNKDTFQSQSYSFGGIRDVLITFSEQIAGAAEIPLVKLFGMSPAGFSTGDADLANYYDTVSRLQEDKLREPISRIASLILTSSGREVGEIDFDFVPLKQETTSERITNAQNAVNTILSVQAAGLISDKRALEEIAALSEKTGIFSTVTPQDIEALNEVEPPPIPNEEGQYVNAGLPNIGKAVDPNEKPNFGAFHLN
jgi:phage-related protein (TIGR01555 family)